LLAQQPTSGLRRKSRVTKKRPVQPRHWFEEELRKSVPLVIDGIFDAGMSRNQLAFEMGCKDYQQFWLYQNGYRSPNKMQMLEMLKTAVRLGIDIETTLELLTSETKQETPQLKLSASSSPLQSAGTSIQDSGVLRTIFDK
tara:strand:- start:15915 stop:16337 length:423 start_codon:yes stop_codon:yes gene_type:complete